MERRDRAAAPDTQLLSAGELRSREPGAEPELLEE